jgi:hypothetical protein
MGCGPSPKGTWPHRLFVEFVIGSQREEFLSHRRWRTPHPKKACISKVLRMLSVSMDPSRASAKQR